MLFALLYVFPFLTNAVIYSLCVECPIHHVGYECYSRTHVEW